MDTMYGRSIEKNEALILIENNAITSIITKNGEYKHIVIPYTSYWKNNDDILFFHLPSPSLQNRKYRNGL